MKNYTFFRTKNPDRRGVYYVKAKLENTSHLSHTQRFKAVLALEDFFLPLAIDTLENRLFLKKSKTYVGTIETKAVYENAEGTIVEVVEDQFDGLIVESKDQQIIEKLYNMFMEYKAAHP